MGTCEKSAVRTGREERDPLKISSVEEMRKMDRTAIASYEIPEPILMENAGAAAFEVLTRHIPIQGTPVLIICGGGNNGGDGFVVARRIHAAGGDPTVFLTSDPERYKDAARQNFQAISRLPLEIRIKPDSETLRAAIDRCGVIVDAIFGTGLSRPVSGGYTQIIEMVNHSGRPVLSLDIPSGINGDTGQVMGCAVQADWTVTFGLPKIGNMLYPGHQFGGTLFVTHISFPPALYRDSALNVQVNTTAPLPPRDPRGHKGRFGDTLFIAGAAGYLGAPYFAAMALLKAGGGYSRLAGPAGVMPFIAMKGSEMVCHPQPETAHGTLALTAKEAICELAGARDMVVMGPGLSRDAETARLIRHLTRRIERPLLIDGDGISAVSDQPEILTQRAAVTILTPHLGEMARLVPHSPEEISENPVPILQEACRRLDAIIVLKGPHTLVGYPEGRIFVNLTGNSGMATAGSGDVLTGTIAAMHGLGLPVPEAVRKGVFIHGLAGDLAAEAIGADGITAQDILEYLPAAVLADRTGLPPALRRRHLGSEIVG